MTCTLALENGKEPSLLIVLASCCYVVICKQTLLRCRNWRLVQCLDVFLIKERAIVQAVYYHVSSQVSYLRFTVNAAA